MDWSELTLRHGKIITILVLLIAFLAALATSMGIFSSGGPGPSDYLSVRGQTVKLYGQGLYRHMSAEVAPQGIAQDYVTLFIGVPLLLYALTRARQGSLRGRFLLAGTLGYFLVTYLFYLVMAMYNALFLVYAGLMGASFFSIAMTLLSFDVDELPERFRTGLPAKPAGGFLIFSTIAIAFLWMSIVVPPLVSGDIYPLEVEHYTTLIVQGMDIGLLLPLAAVSGFQLRRLSAAGFLMGPVYLIFLSLLMAALTAKIIAMGMQGYNIIPAIFIIPTFAAAASYFSVRLLQEVQEMS